jgi:hypothetical protein
MTHTRARLVWAWLQSPAQRRSDLLAGASYSGLMLVRPALKLHQPKRRLGHLGQPRPGFPRLQTKALETVAIPSATEPETEAAPLLQPINRGRGSTTSGRWLSQNVDDPRMKLGLTNQPAMRMPISPVRKVGKRSPHRFGCCVDVAMVFDDNRHSNFPKIGDRRAGTSSARRDTLTRRGCGDRRSGPLPPSPE